MVMLVLAALTFAIVPVSPDQLTKCWQASVDVATIGTIVPQSYRPNTPSPGVVTLPPSVDEIVNVKLTLFVNPCHDRNGYP